MNKYNVIHLDISSFWDDYKANIIEKIKEYVVSDLRMNLKKMLISQRNSVLYSCLFISLPGYSL